MKKIFSILCSIVLCLSLGACDNKTNSVITLSINPSFEIALDSDLNVSNIKALNDDGKKVLESQRETLIGKNTDLVIETLITESNKLGFVNKDKEGFNKDIIITNPKGNVDLNRIKETANKTAKDLNLPSEVITLSKQDFNNKNTVDNSGSYISEEKAKEIAASRLGTNIDQLEFTEKEFEFEKDKHIYDFEVKLNGEVYEIDINASTGAIDNLIKEQPEASGIEQDDETSDDINEETNDLDEEDKDDHKGDEDDLENNNDSDEIDDDDFTEDTDNEDEGDDDSSDDTDDDELK